MSYSDSLRDPRWQRKRLEILQRDDFKCKMCSDPDTTLHVHHKIYQKGKLPWEYEDSNFITYCEHCHALVEHFKTIGREVKALTKGVLKDEALVYFFVVEAGVTGMDVYQLDQQIGLIRRLFGITDAFFFDLYNFYTKSSDQANREAIEKWPSWRTPETENMTLVEYLDHFDSSPDGQKFIEVFGRSLATF